MLKLYVYKNCGTCKKALKWLDAHDAAYKTAPIRETPPTPAELERMLKAAGGNVRKLFNTSGADYRAMDLKDKLPGMDAAKALALLAKNGNLVKRPFVLGKGVALAGFKEAEWEKALL